MSIPELTIPIELPIDIPTLLHPAIVHFVVAIPVVIILLEFINLFFKKRALSLFSLFLILIVATVMAGAYFTGVTDGKEAFSLLSEAGKAELKEHKLLGIYLVYGSLALVLFKLLFMLFKGIISRLFFVLILIGFTAVNLKQGHDGGELVYKYGANSEAIADIISDKDDIQEELEECEGKSKAEPKAEVKQEEPKQEVKVEESATPKEESSSKDTNSTDSNSSN